MGVSHTSSKQLYTIHNTQQNRVKQNTSILISQINSMMSNIVSKTYNEPLNTYVIEYQNHWKTHTNNLSEHGVTYTHITYSHIQSCERIPTSNRY